MPDDTAPGRTSTYRSAFDSAASADCLPDGATVESWTVQFGGYGCVRAETSGDESWLALAPAPVHRAGDTRASLAVGPRQRSRFRLSLRAITDVQLRTGSEPNPWESAWVVWDYADNEHFYYAILKPNGWEIGKRDPAYPGGQRFLATGSTPTFPIGQWYDVTVEKSSRRVSLAVDGVEVATYVDRERPYRRGRIGLYTEDAAVRFADVVLERF